jgi:hypothetical protein
MVEGELEILLLPGVPKKWFVASSSRWRMIGSSPRNANPSAA